MTPFNAGTNQLPQSNAIRQSVFNVKCRLKAGETTSIPYAVYEIDEYDTTKFEYVVKRPTADSIPHARLLIGPGHAVPADKVFMAAQTTDAITIASDTGLTVAVGADMGTQEDEYKIKNYRTGFRALYYDGTAGICLVRQFFAGAMFAEATSNPSDGTLTVKLAESDGTLVGDDITVYDGGIV